MTFTVIFDDPNAKKNQSDQTHIISAVRNLLFNFTQSIGGCVELETRNKNKTPTLEGLAEWSQTNYGITVLPTYTTRIEPHGYLLPNPMADINPTWLWPHIPMESFNLPPISEDEKYLIMDPVFIGPRSIREKEFFKVEDENRINRHRDGPSWSTGCWWHCQTPELKRWDDDVNAAAALFFVSGAKVANDWAVIQGYETANFWFTTRLIPVSCVITLPGCRSKSISGEKRLFIKQFG